MAEIDPDTEHIVYPMHVVSKRVPTLVSCLVSRAFVTILSKVHVRYLPEG